MERKDIITMRQGEMKRLKVITEVLGKRIRQRMAAQELGLSERQIRRIVRAVKEEGDRGVIHRARGRPSNRRIPERTRRKVVDRYRKRYAGFGPTLACEKLLELDRLKLSRETLRKWLIESELWHRQRRSCSHRHWRARKECFGEMVQFDGSRHDWLEGRGPEMTLLSYIDDATGEVFGRFYAYEGTKPAMDCLKRYTQRYGLPLSVYVDRHTTYKSPKKRTDEEELDGGQAFSQFERALDELGVEVIHAYSPQAKGRIERLFGILQDRLVKEMRLRAISTMDQANAFLEQYWSRYNRQFRVCAANPTDVHVRLAPHLELDAYLCIKNERTVAKDHTVAYRGRLFQILTPTHAKKVLIQERLDGSLFIVSRHTKLKYREILDRPAKCSPSSVQPSSWIPAPVMNQFL